MSVYDIDLRGIVLAGWDFLHREPSHIKHILSTCLTQIVRILLDPFFIIATTAEYVD